LLDKLVALPVDLERVCRVGTERVPIVAAIASIAGARDILHSAIVDVCNIIHQVDGLMDLTEVVPAYD
jgi:hypothetical protein